jgi:hypothetical protein
MKIKIVPDHENVSSSDVNHNSVNRSTPYEYVLTAAISNTYSQNSVVAISKVKDKIVKSVTINTSATQNKTPKM